MSELHAVEGSESTNDPVLVWQGRGGGGGRMFRVMARGTVAVPVGHSTLEMRAEFVDGYDMFGKPVWRPVEDAATVAAYIAMAVYAKMVGLPSVAPG